MLSLAAEASHSTGQTGVHDLGLSAQHSAPVARHKGYAAGMNVQDSPRNGAMSLPSGHDSAASSHTASSSPGAGLRHADFRLSAVAANGIRVTSVLATALLGAEAF